MAGCTGMKGDVGLNDVYFPKMSKVEKYMCCTKKNN
jgi:hypothetical protein